MYYTSEKFIGSRSQQIEMQKKKKRLFVLMIKGGPTWQAIIEKDSKTCTL